MTNLQNLTGTYAFDPTHTSLSFTARHAMITKVRGTFDDFTGTIVADGANPENSSVEVVAQIASVDTNNDDRDNHLRSADFFDAEQFPTMTFKSTDVKVKGETFEVTGDLTIKDVTQSVTLPMEFTGAATDPFGQDRIGFEGEVTVNRKDFGLTWNAALETGGVLVSEKIKLNLDVSAVKQA
ncbi:YceI family protein [Ammonicoccus fulvus]|uniref:YceI family protein n=1 Tax=Ammonicoccus fulvus TaxID=3138240 RepID=A0ABZ3FSQ4_9ACTN